jgi:hypothetical protein
MLTAILKRLAPAANSQLSEPAIGASYPNSSLQDAPLTKKRGRPPTDPQERAKWEQHQKAVEKARLAAEAKPTAETGLQRRQFNSVQGAGQQAAGFINERRYKQQQDQPTAAARTKQDHAAAATAARDKTQMTFLQPKFHPAPLGVCSLTTAC